MSREAPDGFLVALDQGTTSSRAIVFDLSGKALRSAARALPVSFPHDGWVEQNAEQILSTQLEALREATSGLDARAIQAIGVTNQRETLIVWDRASGKPLAPAIVWQCRRSGEICDRFTRAGNGEMIRKKTGLVLDPYFSATKLIWLVENIPGIHERLLDQTAVCGTVDSWLVYHLTGGGTTGKFLTEPSNASRTMWYSLEHGDWDNELLKMFSLQRENLAHIVASDGDFGTTNVLGHPVPIRGVLGDQQAALFGNGCLSKLEAKCTFGTGAFLLVNMGEKRVRSSVGLVETVAWRREQGLTQGESANCFALEGSIFIAGAVVQWLRDKLGLISNAAESESVAASVPDTGGVVMVPAFVGLGAPYWDKDVRGSFVGLTRDTSRAHLVRACLEGVAHQVADLLEAPEFSALSSLRIDGGMSRNKLFCQILADVTSREVTCSSESEMTALGVALMAGLGAGVFSSVEALSAIAGGSSTVAHRFTPQLALALQREQRERWKLAIEQVRLGTPGKLIRQ